jgi:2-polyprenyl-6-hydroxyphenyl methylase/3-demethylubiquinone-9 3-methyltransferase
VSINPAAAGFFYARRHRVERCDVPARGTRITTFMRRNSHFPAMIPVMNADPLELQKFSDLAHRWWDPTSEFRPLHEINPLRLEWINARAPLAGKTVLDIGCGGGILTESMAKKGAAVSGIDLSEKALKVADLHSLESGVQVRYEMISAEQLAAREPARYDIVTCMEMLEHVPDPASVVRACATLVKPGGQVFFSTLNRNPKSYLFAVIGAEYLLRLLPRGTHDYAKFITPAELSQFIRNAKMTVESLKGMSYNPLTQMYSLNQDTSVNYLIACSRPS